MSYSFDVIVIGAGVVGLACAKKFAESGFETLVVESESNFGSGTSSRNSEVLHAGIYYAKDTSKARLCIQGLSKLYDYCEIRNIKHKKIGKWIVAQNEYQIEKLHKIKKSGEKNGRDDLFFVDSKSKTMYEPYLKAKEVLCSPSTGIIDSHGLMQSFVGDISNNGGVIVYKTKCVGVEVKNNGFAIRLNDTEETKINCKKLINACGLNAVEFITQIDKFPKSLIPISCFAKGNYFTYSGKVPFQRLIYPIPEVGGLGIHLTLDLNDQAKFGPDVEWVEDIDYKVNESSKQKFFNAIKTYWPNCKFENLIPGYAGIRPKIGNQEDFLNDFVIQYEQEHGVPGLVNLLGIESPGLTSSLAIAEDVFQHIN